MKLHFSGLVVLACAFAACSKEDKAPTVVVPQPETFSASLSGGGEVPAVSTAATGSATISVLNGVATYTVSVNGLSGPPTASHIHGPADATVAVGVIVPFTITPGAAASGTIATGTFTSTSNPAMTFDSLLVLLRTGKAYVNVHTAAHGGGEIRGTVTKP
jgi:hypothetical protein